MAKSIGAINSLDDLYGKPKTEVIVSHELPMILISQLVPFHEHPYRMYVDERLTDMISSIKEMGIVHPIIVQPLANNNMYEILCGHNRVNAARIIGLTEVPAIIKKNLTEDEARLYVTETNMHQRSFADLSHSERAHSLKMHFDAIKHQGKRTDRIKRIEEMMNEIGVNADVSNLSAHKRISEKYGLSERNISRYLRLAGLSKVVLDKVDTEEIPFVGASDSLAFLSHDEQLLIVNILEATEYKITLANAKTLRETAETKRNALTYDEVLQILSGTNGKQNMLSVRLKYDTVQQYFSKDAKPSEIASVITQALAQYFENKGV